MFKKVFWSIFQNSFRILATLFVFFVGFVILVRPSNNRDWNLDQAILPEIKFDGDLAHIKNVRNFSYRSTSDFIPAYYDKTLDLSTVKRVWFIVEPFSGFVGAAHTFLSFEFDGKNGKDFIAVSIEIRKTKGEVFSAWKGLLRQYEIMYVIADERDVVKLRSNYRKDDVFVYPIKATPQKARALLTDMLVRANTLTTRPEFYNTVTNTCTTNIIDHVNTLVPKRIPFSMEWLFPKNSDKVAVELGLIDDPLQLSELRTKYKINSRAEKYADDPMFSLKIRN